MSEEIQKELNSLKKELSIQKAVNATDKFSFDEEDQVSVCKAIANLEDQEDKDAIIKAFNILLSRVEEEVEKAKDSSQLEENELAKSLAKEAGEGGESEPETKMSTVEKVLARQEGRDNKETK